MNWSDKPLLRIVIPFIIGIVLAISFPGIPHLHTTAGVLFVFYTILIINQKMRRSFTYRWLYGVIIYVILILIGYQLTSQKANETHKAHVKDMVLKPGVKVVTIVQPPEEKEKTYKVIAEIMNRAGNKQLHACTTKVMLYLRKDKRSSKLLYGDVLATYSIFTPIPAPTNPDIFNYKKFLSYRQIHYQAFVDSGQWEKIGSNNGNPLFRTAFRLQNHFLTILKSAIPGDEEFAIASALMLGYRNYLPAHVKQAYSNTGAMHILAVSGLHVGIIYLIINSLLSIVLKRKWLQVYKSLIVMVFIWLFAIITGLSPSVLRAAAMFSFMCAGNMFNRYTNIYNTLAGSALIILCFDPFMITNIGFQLSYLAVIGIVYFQPKIYKLFVFNQWLSDKIWVLSSVAIAAQITTFPLSLLYFHKFPTLFLLSNLVVIPAAIIILNLGIALFTFSTINIISSVIGKMLYYILHVLNNIIYFFEQLPYSMINGIEISIPQTILIYLLIISISLLAAYRHIRFLRLALLITILISCMCVLKTFNIRSQKKMIVYNIPGNSAVSFVCGSNIYFIADSILVNDKKTMDFFIKPNWQALGCKKPFLIDKQTSDTMLNNFRMKDQFVQFYNKTMVFINKPLHYHNAEQKLSIDYLLVSKNKKLHIEALPDHFNFKKIIFDASNSKWVVKEWISICKKYKIPYHDIASMGAFIIDV